MADTRCIDAKFHLHQSNLKHPKKIPNDDQMPVSDRHWVLLLSHNLPNFASIFMMILYKSI
ncbi:hypothetical protein AO376_1993 [Moraxella catarrhalis]|nr:hypothetical protein [Moraxella catarrhalis]OAV12486.1 hypothetical protein AO376_1993 [Moraxella catarrhalis]OAV16826.1 hypothetical protein AO374_1361 [Moraxella catarrhalis]OBX45005.1 hypothetical protein A9Z57_03490 [Moraxella catarrhalis]